MSQITKITSELIIDLEDVEIAKSIDEPFLDFNEEEISFLPKRCCLTSNISVNISDKENLTTTSTDESYSNNNIPNYEDSNNSLSDSLENNITIVMLMNLKIILLQKLITIMKIIQILAYFLIINR